jgi:hypothetical protein
LNKIILLIFRFTVKKRHRHAAAAHVLFFIGAIGQLAFFTDIHQFPNPKFNNKSAARNDIIYPSIVATTYLRSALIASPVLAVATSSLFLYRGQLLCEPAAPRGKRTSPVRFAEI